LELGDPIQTAAERGGNNLKGFKDFHTGNGSSRGQNLALTGAFVPSSLDSGLIFQVPGYRSARQTFPRGPSPKITKKLNVLAEKKQVYIINFCRVHFLIKKYTRQPCMPAPLAASC